MLEYSDLEKGPEVWEPQVEKFLDAYMRREGWEQEVLEDEEAWEARKKELMKERRDDDRNRSYRGGGMGKYGNRGGGPGKYSKRMDGGRS